MSHANDTLPFSQSCENNKQPILAQLRELLTTSRYVLEIAGGTGQHAEYFAAHLPHLRWQSSDVPENVATLSQRLVAAHCDNLPRPLALNVDQPEWLTGHWPQEGSRPARTTATSSASNTGVAALAASFDKGTHQRALSAAGDFDALYSANSLHIMSAGSVTHFFLGAGKLLNEGAKLIVYGPFNYSGAFTSPSNAEFDARLKERNAHSGIRDFESVSSIADIAGFALEHDVAMPANNRLLVWRKRAESEA